LKPRRLDYLEYISVKEAPAEDFQSFLGIDIEPVITILNQGGPVKAVHELFG
jgi:hypothetical protein